jgi:signal transduction histidine kinase
MNDVTRQHRPHAAWAIASATAAILASAALLGLAVPGPMLALGADWAPIPAGAGVGLLLASVALFAASRGRTAWAVGLGGTAATLGAWVLVHAWLAAEGGTTPEAGASLPHGAMPPNSALGVLLLGLSATCVGTRARALAAVCSLAAGVLGAGALIGYATGLDPAYRWGGEPMAPVTATGLLVLSSGVLWGRVSASDRSGAWTVPLGAVVATLTLVFLFHQALLVRRASQIDATVDATAQRIRTEVRVAVRGQRNALGGLAREWYDVFFKRRGAWESDVRIALAMSRGMASMAWFEPDGRLNWTYPSRAYAPQIPLPSPEADPTVVQGWMRSVPLEDGTIGFALLAPILDSKGIDGWLCGFFDARGFFGELSSALPDGFWIRVDSGPALLYEGGDGTPALDGRWAHDFPLELGSEVRLTVRPTTDWVAAQTSSLPAVLMAGGVLVALLLFWALRSARLARAHAVALEGEVEAHERTEAEVRRLNLGLEERVEQRTAELRRTNEELKGFASFLSHELRQPVFAQALWAQMLEEDHGRSLDEEGREYVAEIRRSTQRLGDLIDGQLWLAQLGSAPASAASVDLDAVLAEVATDLKRDLDEADATLHREPLPPVLGHAPQLYQLFRNLVENSVKYRRAEAPLHVRIAGERHGDLAEIVYEDDGRGFDPADAERIFEPFERGPGGGQGGLGLGLALCRRIVERGGGRIVAEGRPGRGATFRVRLPAPAADD